MIKITPVMKELLDKALADGTPCLIGTASKDGHPQISPKGSVAVFDDSTLCYWERSHRSSQKRGSAKIRMSWSITAIRRGRRIRIAPAASASTARRRIVTSGPERDKAWSLTNHEEQSKDPDKKGAAVIIDLDLIEQIDSSVIMKRD